MKLVFLHNILLNKFTNSIDFLLKTCYPNPTRRRAKRGEIL
nr:MAG TPA: hypothetical protein [Caudoviricetes sp.]